MSLSADNSLQDSLLYTLLVSAASTSSVSSTPPEGSPDATAVPAKSNPAAAVTADLSALMRALNQGDDAAAKSHLTELRKDIKSYQAELASTGRPPAAKGSAGGLDELTATLSERLKSGDTQGALHAIASYLVGSSQSSGALVNALG